MSRPAQSNPNSRSVHTKNNFSAKHAILHIKTNLISHNASYRKKPSASLIEKQNADNNCHPIVFKSRKNKDFIVTDAVLKNEDITVALAFVVAIYAHLTNQFMIFCWR